MNVIMHNQVIYPKKKDSKYLIILSRLCELLYKILHKDILGVKNDKSVVLPEDKNRNSNGFELHQ